MSVKIPSSFEFDLGVDVDLDISGVPTSYSIGVSQLPKINIGVDPIEIRPLDMTFSLKSIPSVRVHLPLHYQVGLALFGNEVLCVRLCGEGQVITEPYQPNPCECGYRAVRPQQVDPAPPVVNRPG